MAAPAGAAEPILALRPRLVLRIGVIGHRPRRGRPLAAAAIAETADRTLAEIGAALQALFVAHIGVFADAPPLIRLASGLAEGADQIVLGAALDRPGPADPKEARRAVHECAAILPFPAETCRALMGSARAKARFDALLAACSPVMAMADAPTPDGLAALAEDERRDAYIAQAQALMEHSDVLFAIWDGRPARGPGGTETTIRAALDLGLPVIVISPEGVLQGEIAALAPRGAARDAATTYRMPDWPALTRHICAPPSPLATAPGNGHHGGTESHGALEHGAEEDASQRLVVFLSEQAALPTGGALLPRLALHRFLRKLLGGDGPGSAFAGLRLPTEPISAAPAPWRSATTGLADDTRLDAILARRWQWADALAVRYAELNRSSVIAVPLIGFLAVAMGLIGFILASKNDAAGYAMKAVLLLLEIALLLFAYERHFKEPRREHWHRRQVEYRSLAELLRHERFLHLAGFGGRLSRAGAQAGLPDEWIGWHLRATIRELGFPHVTLGPGYYARLIARADAIEIRDTDHGQIAYNEARRAECHLVEHRLHGFASGLFWWLILPVGILGVAYVSALSLVKAGAAPVWLAALTDLFPKVTSNLITACMALAPATIAALHSVRAQIDFEEQARRTGDTAQKLRAISAIFTREAATGAVSRERARRLLGDLTETLSADLSGWSTVYRHKGPEQPG